MFGGVIMGIALGFSIISIIVMIIKIIPIRNNIKVIPDFEDDIHDM